MDRYKVIAINADGKTVYETESDNRVINPLIWVEGVAYQRESTLDEAIRTHEVIYVERNLFHE